MALLIVPPGAKQSNVHFFCQSQSGATLSSSVFCQYAAVMGRKEFHFLHPCCKAIAEEDLATIQRALADGTAKPSASWQHIDQETVDVFQWVADNAVPYQELKRKHENGEDIKLFQQW